MKRCFDLLTHPEDLPTRFAVLHLYYHLPSLLVAEEESTFGSSYEDVDELQPREDMKRQAQRRTEKFEEDLGMLHPNHPHQLLHGIR